MSFSKLNVKKYLTNKYKKYADIDRCVLCYDILDCILFNLIDKKKEIILIHSNEIEIKNYNIYVNIMSIDNENNITMSNNVNMHIMKSYGRSIINLEGFDLLVDLIETRYTNKKTLYNFRKSKTIIDDSKKATWYKLCDCIFKSLFFNYEMKYAKIATMDDKIYNFFRRETLLNFIDLRDFRIKFIKELREKDNKKILFYYLHKGEKIRHLCKDIFKLIYKYYM